MSLIELRGRDPATGEGLQVTIEDGAVAAAEAADAPENIWISAGLVDLQVNGFGGLDLNADGLNAATVSALVRRLLETGVTAFAPTLITANQQSLLQRLAAIDEACCADELARECIPFIHMEGPWISPRDGYRGAHPLEGVRPPSLGEFEQWQDACGGRIGMMTLSPHYPKVETIIAHLVKQGIHISLGHTDASEQQIERAALAGARLSTHLGNGIAAEIPRHDNPIWGQLADERLTASFIADGHHLPAAALKAMMRAKGPDRCLLVSDATALAGMPAGEYDSRIGGRVSLSTEGRLSIAGTSLLAGAATPLLRCVEHAVRMTGMSLAAALRMATEIPGRFAGRGRLAVGERADVFRFHWDDDSKTAMPHDVWVGGMKVYDAGV